MSGKYINVVNANEHNLKGVSVKIPKDALTVVTGPSGSGKSSLAFDTVYVEGQRRYIESLSSYARQFLGQHQAPDVESIDGLSPAISINQKTTSKSPRSTVGTVTEIYDYLRILYSRAGTLYCPKTGKEVQKYSPARIAKEIIKHKEGTKVHILAPISSGDVKNKKLLKTLLMNFLDLGFARIRINEKIVPLEANIKLPSKIKSCQVVIDRIVVKADINKRLVTSTEQALKHGGGDVIVLAGEKEFRFSQYNKAEGGSQVYPDLEPRLFSFNSPIGACDTCKGLGESKTFDESLMITDPSLSIKDGAIAPLAKGNSFLYRMIECVAKAEKVSLSTPLKKMSKRFRDILMYGSNKNYKFSFISDNSRWEFSGDFYGIIESLDRKFIETGSERVRKRLEQWMSIKTCPDCKGGRLNPVALATLIDKKNIIQVSAMSIEQALKHLSAIKLSGEKKVISERIFGELKKRLQFLLDVGLGYLTLDRPATSLSGGESQRIRLATQIGSALTGVLYVLDEPSIGLHQRDNSKLIRTLKSLRDLGNTVLVIEHDEETMLEADHIIDVGPGAGLHGGTIVHAASKDQFIKNTTSLTAKYLSGKESIAVPRERRSLTKFIELKGATQNNLKKLDVAIPLGGFVAITGVSGSGKSTLMHDVFVPACRTNLSRYEEDIYAKQNYKSIKGVEHIDSIIEITQSPIGRTPKSNPATYAGVFDEIRKLYSQTPESKVRGYKPGRFSFNVRGGRCEECEGNGTKKIEMHFLPDVHITCDDCKGSRYNRETLAVLYKGKHISDILNMTIEESREFFEYHPKINRIFSTLCSVGLGYMKLGQPATTLSGGEAQRLKLSRELSKRPKGHCIYVLDEPTTGLHFADLKILLGALEKLVEKGNTVLIIEHNLDVIKSVDYIIDLGPEGGPAGGTIVAQGRPEKVAQVTKSHTGKYLKKVLK